MLIGIVAMDAAGAIGRGGGLPWHYPADMRFFKEQTTGHACVMGRKTWLTLRRPLPNRLNLVLSRGGEPEPRESVVWLRDPVSVLSLKDYLRCDLYVIGGAQIYRTFLDRIDRWLVTRVPLAVAGADTFMPPDFLRHFRPADTRDLGDGLLVTFYEREKKSAGESGVS